MEATASTRRPSTWYLSSQNSALADQKTADFIAAVIEDEGFPFGMKTLARVSMFVKMRAVEVGQPVLVSREV